MKTRQFPLTPGELGGNNYTAEDEVKGGSVDDRFMAMFAEMRRLLREKGWTQRRLCAALGRSEAWLSKIIHAGRGMDVTDLLKICEVTGIPPERLLAGFPCERNAESEEDTIARRLSELLPEDVLQKLIEIRKNKT